MNKLTTYRFNRVLWGILFTLICIVNTGFAQEKISLAGQWNIKLDPKDTGIQGQWSNDSFSKTIMLPGSVQEQGYGDEPSVDTEWTASNYQQFFELEKYAPYRTKDNFKFPYWLTPEKYYKGVAWFQKEVTIPKDWKNKRIILELERVHWGTMVFVDNQRAGADSSLTTPHRYDLSSLLTPGNHTITIRIDNRLLYQVGVNAHSVSDHTQTNWNGIVGKLTLKADSPLYISNVQIYPDLKNKEARVKIYLKNQTGSRQSGEIRLQATTSNTDKMQTLTPVQQSFSINREEIVEIIYPMGKDPMLWDEFDPNLYTMKVSLDSENKYKDVQKVDFGIRSFKTEGKRFTINGRPVFLRGTLECAIFPETGYPPTTKAEWAHHFDVMKQHGLNHMRFHSWSPPEAAFKAADEAGIYLQVEGPLWANQGSSIGDGRPIDQFLIDESKRIIKEYGNHPSFVMFASGNEPAGDHQEEFLGEFVSMWKQKDSRRVYTSASGWPAIPQNDYHDIPAPRIQQWGQGLKSTINANPPSTDWNFSDIIQKHERPVVGHEIGQWCVYPNFDEMSKYTGVLKPKNFEIFRDLLKKNHMLWQAHDFHMASGKLQALCYKADIEAALRTPNYAGYQMLDLHDFPGQGTALVGILDPFWDSKPYINATEFNRFSASTVPLAVMKKRTWTNVEMFKADLKIAHFGSEKAEHVPVQWHITNSEHQIVAKGETRIDLSVGNNIPAGNVSLDLSDFEKAQKLNLEVSVGPDTSAVENDWDFWVYPEKVDTKPSSDLIVTQTLTPDIEQKLKDGANVLLQLHGKLKKGKGKEVMAGFSTIFWNTAWTGGQAPQTMGVLVEPKNPLFNTFPTAYHTDWQWWDIVHDVHPMILNDFPANLIPSIQMIDTWFNARKLGLLFESKIGEGKLVVTSIDFEHNLEDRLASRQLYESLLNYMESDDFNPEVRVNLRFVKELYE